MKTWCLVAALLLSLCARASIDERRGDGEASRVFRGTWTATASPGHVFRGTWSGQASPGAPNSVQGSWTLPGETGEVVLEGTWSAQKTRLGWHGAWSARTVAGRSLSGTWSADIADLAGRTFEEMLGWTAEKAIAGSWRSGRYQGNWWLKGSSQGHSR